MITVLHVFLDVFHIAVSPHGGAGIGMERVVFLYLGKRLLLLIIASSM